MRIAPVSVIVPCYRCAGTIERAVRSVAAQTARPAELILVDDGTADGTSEALERMRSKFGEDWIRVLRLPANVGPASARNAGWDAATQRYIAFLDADDAWHPRKVEIQCGWMEAHPEVAVSGHDSRQLASDAEIPSATGGGQPRRVGPGAFYISNQFITPSVMLRRELPQRFEPGMRYMEDYLLWLEIAKSGRRVDRLPQVLAYTFKAPFGEAGLSANAWQMERGELDVFATLRRKGQLGPLSWLLLSLFSMAKFVRRVLMLATGYSPGAHAGPTFLYVAAYIVLTQSMSGLLIIAGFFGDSRLAAEIGVAQAATLATFFAFSGNARNLILTDRANVQRGALVSLRVCLLLPLGFAAALLCAIAGNVEPLLIAILVARRAVEWIAELHISECELLGRQGAARGSLLLQVTLLIAAALAIVAEAGFLLWVLAAWALLPAVPLVRYVVAGWTPSLGRMREVLRFQLPHFGATASSGMSLYAFRVLLVLVADKAVAGILFTAFAVGSFPGALFANALGPSVSLHEERSGRAYLPKALWLVLVSYLAGGIALLALHWAVPALFAQTGKEPLFWTALGWSLLGGVVMIVAQRVRLKLIGTRDARDLFGADVLTHVYLIAMIPALYAVGRSDGLALLYMANAVLALLFCLSGMRGQAVTFGHRAEGRLVAAVAFFVFLPMFFLVSGRLFNPAEPLVDSGGILRNLPLPVSLFACSAGLLFYGRYSRALPGLWTIFGLLFLMLVSTSIAGGESGSLERAKMLLLLQILLPTFGLVLGAVLDARDRHASAIALGVFWAAALVVPAQLIATWLEGYRTLRHSVFVFGVYQHLQFVPVVLASAYLVALPGLWERWGAVGRSFLAGLFMLLAIYVVGAHAVLGMAAVAVGAVWFGMARLWRARDRAAALMAVAVLGAGAGYMAVAAQTYEFRHKFSFLFPGQDPWAFVGAPSPGAKARLAGGWEITGKPSDGLLLRVTAFSQGQRAVLIAEGHLQRGAIEFLVERRPGDTSSWRVVESSGPFSVQIPVDRHKGEADVLIYQRGPQAQGTISSLRWRPLPEQQAASPVTPPAPAVVPAAAAPAATAAAVPEKAASWIPNLSERISDWFLFGEHIAASPEALLFGHSKPLAREKRTSAHNFYIDFVYNFGLLALLPLLALIVYTAALLWRQRSAILASEELLALAAVVLFLVLVESNLKVTLRQPYPGVASYFLWGLLLARLRMPAAKGS